MDQTTHDTQSPAAATCREPSLLKPIGYQPGDCGYCKKDESSQRSPKSRGSFYVSSKSLCSRHYQILVDRGWRRSGTILYLPDVARSCCPHYTIRLPVASFKPGRDLRQTLYRWNRFVLGEDYAIELNKKYPKTKHEKKKAATTFDLVKSIHESESSHIPSGLKPAHDLTITLEPDTFSEEKFALFQDYQTTVHREPPSEVSRGGFQRFLCDSPLHRHADAPTRPLGSYHQTYRLDGRLIALAVLDLLPHAVSGVYFIYHSDFAAHSLGKVSALREAALAAERGYEFYYMGYYIHSCPKMRYKGDYRPQFVLDLHDHGWNELDDGMKRLMDERQYASPWQEGRRREMIEGKETVADEEEVADEVDVVAETPQQVVTLMMHDGRSLLDLRMPGVMTAEQVEAEVDLGTVKISLGRTAIHQTQDLVGWEEGSVTDPRSIKGIIADFAACIGAEAIRDVVVDFSR